MCSRTQKQAAAGVLAGTVLHVWLLCAMAVLASPADGLAAVTAYVDTTRALDLDRVQVVVVTSPAWKARLYDRAMALFATAGLPRPASPVADSLPLATLQLTLDARALPDSCPGHVLYAPSLTLTEAVILPRNSVVVQNITWFLGGDTQVRGPIELSALEADVDRLIHQFITDYKAGNPKWASERPPGADAPAIFVLPNMATVHGNAVLKDLSKTPLRISVLTGRWTDSLMPRAMDQLTQGGLRVASDPHDDGTVMLGVELLQRSLEASCPGKVLYEQGVYLVEQVQLIRNPKVMIWSDTWLRETAHILPPRSLQQVEADQEALLRQFLDGWRAP